MKNVYLVCRLLVLTWEHSAESVNFQKALFNTTPWYSSRPASPFLHPASREYFLVSVNAIVSAQPSCAYLLAGTTVLMVTDFSDHCRAVISHGFVQEHVSQINVSWHD